jgi:hypothetical protein
MVAKMIEMAHRLQYNLAVLRQPIAALFFHLYRQFKSISQGESYEV